MKLIGLITSYIRMVTVDYKGSLGGEGVIGIGHVQMYVVHGRTLVSMKLFSVFYKLL